MAMLRYCVLLTLCCSLLPAQHGYTPADAEEGEQLFIENCARCHGPEGDAVPGVQMARGKFRHAESDEELGQVIKNGIPGTAMPPGSFHEHQITALIAYLRSMAASISDKGVALGDIARGKEIFQGRGGCLNCHRANGKGSYVGPELSDIGAIRRAAQLQRSLIEPDAEILPQNRSYRVVTRDGKTVTGRLLNLDTFTVQLMDSDQQLQSLLKSDLKEFGFIDKSPMQSYRGKLSDAELADILAYLVSLKGNDRP
jgi:putative heme-binding domain-containing protein